MLRQCVGGAGPEAFLCKYCGCSFWQLHVRTADEAVNVGPAAAADSYLNMEAILAAVDRTGAQAVSTCRAQACNRVHTPRLHGLRACRSTQATASFPRISDLQKSWCVSLACWHPLVVLLSLPVMQAKRGVTFIGPGVHAIRVMGDKLESKRTALQAGVNTIPGFDGIVKVTRTGMQPVGWWTCCASSVHRVLRKP